MNFSIRPKECCLLLHNWSIIIYLQYMRNCHVLHTYHAVESSNAEVRTYVKSSCLHLYTEKTPKIYILRNAAVYMPGSRSPAMLKDFWTIITWYNMCFWARMHHEFSQLNTTTLQTPVSSSFSSLAESPASAAFWLCKHQMFSTASRVYLKLEECARFINTTVSLNRMTDTACISKITLMISDNISFMLNNSYSRCELSNCPNICSWDIPKTHKEACSRSASPSLWRPKCTGYMPLRKALCWLCPWVLSSSSSSNALRTYQMLLIGFQLYLLCRYTSHISRIMAGNCSHSTLWSHSRVTVNANRKICINYSNASALWTEGHVTPAFCFEFAFPY